MRDDITRKIVTKILHKDYPTQHHINSYNQFVTEDVKNTIKKMNPIFVKNGYNEEDNTYRYESKIYIGGKEGNKLYYSTPAYYQENKEPEPMYPNYSRLNANTYACVLMADIVIEHKLDGVEIEEPQILEKVIINDQFPIMLRSKLCLLHNASPEELYFYGECAHEKGGYFIIDGNEKCIVSIERQLYNLPIVTKMNDDNMRTFLSVTTTDKDEILKRKIQMMVIKRNYNKIERNSIRIALGLFRTEIPLFVMFRALGVITDKEIIRFILGTTEHEYTAPFQKVLMDCARDSLNIYDQETALKYMSTFLKEKSLRRVLYYLNFDFAVNIDGSLREKAAYLGYLVRRLLFIDAGIQQPNDKDDYQYKRVSTSGELLHDLFTEYYEKFTRQIMRKMTEIYNYNKSAYDNRNYLLLLESNENYTKIFDKNIIKDGIMKGMKGNWGSKESTQRAGVSQELARISYYDTLSHLRRIINPMDSTLKLKKPRQLNGTHIGFLCPLETPTGAQIGFVKNLANTCEITSRLDSKSLYSYIENVVDHKILDVDAINNNKLFLIFVNGIPMGFKNNIIDFHNQMIGFRENGRLHRYVSLILNIMKKEYHIFTDRGRFTRPILKLQNGNIPIQKWLLDKIVSDNQDFSFDELFYGTDRPNSNTGIMQAFIISDEFQNNNRGICFMIDIMETSTHYIAVNDSNTTNQHTCREIHPGCLLGILGSVIPFGQNNPGVRNLYSCGQTKAAVGIYHTNYNERFDTTSYLLNYPQKPIASSWYHRNIAGGQMNYGFNAIVALATYSGYNQEDAIIVNKTSVERGLYVNTYYKQYYEFEETNPKTGDETRFMNPLQIPNIEKQTKGANYQHLDDNGIIKIGTKLKEGMVIVGKVLYMPNSNPIDVSLIAGRLDTGIVDKLYVSKNINGDKQVRVRIVKERKPEIGDKFSSRAGQKGTIGILLDAIDMPKTEDGITPDIIVNPHAFPSRMTIGQVAEMLSCQYGIVLGQLMDATVFDLQDPIGDLSKKLPDLGIDSMGDKLLYSGITGDLIPTKIFFGPCYYMRLKLQVQDKINYRARGPKVLRTRQPVQGRGKGGGLRIGEMERDCLISHGVSIFLKEGMMERSDKFSIGVDNHSGYCAPARKKKYGPTEYLSLGLDGPLEFEMDELQNKAFLKSKPFKGNDFSRVELPYSYKLFTQEVEGINNMCVRYITDKQENVFLPPDVEFDDSMSRSVVTTIQSEPVVDEDNESQNENESDDDEDDEKVGKEREKMLETIKNEFEKLGLNREQLSVLKNENDKPESNSEIENKIDALLKSRDTDTDNNEPNINNQTNENDNNIKKVNIGNIENNNDNKKQELRNIINSITENNKINLQQAIKNQINKNEMNDNDNNTNINMNESNNPKPINLLKLDIPDVNINQSGEIKKVKININDMKV
jgi:DNA-directed RNA polymerase II subunit RPB2